MNTRTTDTAELGVATLEFALTAAFFFLMLVVVIAGGLLFFTRSALVECTRRSARFAAMQAATTPAGTVRTTPAGTCDSTGPSLTAIRNVAMNGNPAGTGPKLVPSLLPSNICVEYSAFGVGSGTVSVSITGYTYNFLVPGINLQITMPPFRSTVVGESVGTTPS
jgi:TadE-like protein